MKSWVSSIGRLAHQIAADRLTVVAPGIAFYGLLALLPTLVAIISIYGLAFDPDQMVRQVASVSRLLPQQAANFVQQQLTSLTNSGYGALGLGTAGSVVVALWCSSAGVRTLMQGLNVAYDFEERRGLLLRIGLSLLFAAMMIVGMLIAMTAIVLLPILGDILPLDGLLPQAIGWMRWPIVALSFWFALVLLYRYGPDRRDRSRAWIHRGAVVALVVWLGASLGFSAYVRHFGTFNRTYGSMGAVVVLLFWFLLSAWAVLIGAEVNAVFERARRREPKASLSAHASTPIKETLR